MNIKKITEEFRQFDEQLGELGTAISIFGGARWKPESKWYQEAYKTANLLGKNGYSIITGGGPGVMEAANKGAAEADAESVGLVITLPFEAVDNDYIDRRWNVKFDYFFPRKVAFVTNSAAFVVMPGGAGTLDEFYEVITLIQCGKIKKRPVILYGEEFWKGQIDFIYHMIDSGTMSAKDRGLFKVANTPEEVLAIINHDAVPNEEAKKPLIQIGSEGVYDEERSLIIK